MLIDLTGQRFGLLTVIKRSGTQGKSSTWLCRCDCGNECTVQGGNLRARHTTSCGCYRREFASKNAKTHGMTKTRLYRLWQRMRERCYLKTKDGYDRYGGRGITVCPEWMDSFEAFRDWAIANGYRDDLTLDRMDNDGPYSPENCRWSTIVEQANNKSTSRLITYGGRTQTLAQWAHEIGIGRDTLRHRIESGWSIERALTEPRNEKRDPTQRRKNNGT